MAWAGRSLKVDLRGGAFYVPRPENHEVYIGLITDLNYANPHVSPFEEFQRWKTHPKTQAQPSRGGNKDCLRSESIGQRWIQLAADYAFPGRTVDWL